MRGFLLPFPREFPKLISGSYLRRSRSLAINQYYREPVTDQDLVRAAWDARRSAAAAYSNFQVGAALLTANGMVYSGCNVESSSYGLSCCAERVALFKAISEGERKFTRIAVCAVGHGTVTPCGACRQLLSDYCGDIVLLLSPAPEQFEVVMLSDIFQRPFTPSMLT